MTEDGNRREFLFPSDTIEVKTLITKAIQTAKYSDISLRIARRLRGKDTVKQLLIESRTPGIDISQGTLVFFMIQSAPEIKRYFISEAE